MRHHPQTSMRTFVTGMLGSALVIVLVAMVPPVQEALAFIRVFGTVHVPGIPLAKDMVRIEAGTPFVVPNEKFLLIRAIGKGKDPQVNDTLEILFDGNVIMSFSFVQKSLLEFAVGFAAPPGTQVTITANGPAVYALGVLEDA